MGSPSDISSNCLVSTCTLWGRGSPSDIKEFPSHRFSRDHFCLGTMWLDVTPHAYNSISQWTTKSHICLSSDCFQVKPNKGFPNMQSVPFWFVICSQYEENSIETVLNIFSSCLMTSAFQPSCHIFAIDLESAVALLHEFIILDQFCLKESFNIYYNAVSCCETTSFLIK